MRRVRLTESDLRQIVRESINTILNEVSHGYVQARVDAARKKALENGGDREEQIGRITNAFNDVYGSDNIKYDFNQNEKIQPGDPYLQYVHSPGSYRNVYNIERKNDEQNQSGGVTINGERYVPGKKIGRVIHDTGKLDHHKEGEKVEDLRPGAMETYGQRVYYGPGVFKNGQRVDPGQFSEEEINALNNVNDTREYIKGFLGDRMTLKGGRPFKARK